jgi:hypothetical protein
MLIQVVHYKTHTWVIINICFLPVKTMFTYNNQCHMWKKVWTFSKVVKFTMPIVKIIVCYILLFNVWKTPTPTTLFFNPINP